MVVNAQCEHCASPFESDGQERTVFCPNCGKETGAFDRCPNDPITVPAADITTSAVPITHSARRRLKTSTLNIRGKADLTTAGGLILVMLGLLLFLAMLAINNPITESRLIGYGKWLIEVGVGLFLIAQVIHIRANTHRDE